MNQRYFRVELLQMASHPFSVFKWVKILPVQEILKDVHEEPFVEKLDFLPFTLNLCTSTNRSCLLRLRETNNSLQLPVFLLYFFCWFLCQPCPWFWNCKSVFMILKISQYGGGGDDLSFFQGIHVRTDIKIYISKYDHQFWHAGGVNSCETNQVGADDVVTSGSRDKLKASPLPEWLWPPNLAGWHFS